MVTTLLLSTTITLCDATAMLKEEQTLLTNCEVNSTARLLQIGREAYFCRDFERAIHLLDLINTKQEIKPGKDFLFMEEIDGTADLVDYEKAVLDRCGFRGKS